MLRIYQLISKLIDILLNTAFILQISLVVLIFLTAAYWLFDLLNNPLFSFAEPIANTVSDIVRLLYKDDVMLGGIYVDGSLLLFDVVSLLLVFGITKLKYYLNKANETVNIEINKCYERIEKNFNKQLRKDAENIIKKCSNTAILVQFEPQNMMLDTKWGGDTNNGLKEKEDEAFKIFYASIKNITGCKFAKTDDKMLILLNDFEKTDNLLHFIDESVNRIRKNMKQRKWLLLSYIAIDTYENSADFKKEIYPNLEKLINLRHKNDIISFSNFNTRYNLLKTPMYSTFLKGYYNINGENCKIWSIIKKN